MTTAPRNSPAHVRRAPGTQSGRSTPWSTNSAPAQAHHVAVAVSAIACNTAALRNTTARGPRSAEVMKPATFDRVNGNSSGQSANQREPEVSGAQWYANTPGTSARRYTLLRAAGSLRHATTGGAPHDPSMLSADVPPTPWTRNSITSMVYARWSSCT